MSGQRPGTRIVVATDDFRGPVLVREDGPVDGPAVLLIHGFCGSGGWYDGVARDLADHFRVIRPDLLGHGGTGGHAADAPRQARVLAGLLERLAVRRVTVVGHSFGADVAVELAEISTRVQRTMIVCQAPDYSDINLPARSDVMTVPVLGRVLLGTGRLASRGLGAVLAVRPPKDPAARVLARRALADFRALDHGMFRVILAERRDRLAARPLDAQLRDAGKPALVVLGSNDHFYGDRCADRYRAAGARVEVVADAGHSLQIEQPALVARLVREFATEAVPAG